MAIALHHVKPMRCYYTLQLMSKRVQIASTVELMELRKPGTFSKVIPQTLNAESPILLLKMDLIVSPVSQKGQMAGDRQPVEEHG